MKKLFLGSVALVALGLGAPAAFAADRAVPAYAPPPPPAPVYTWSGCYAGANAGYSAGRSTQTTVANSVLTGGGLGVPAPAPLGLPGGGVIAPVPVGSSIAGDLNLSGFIGGFQGGCNYQFGQWVVGAEVDGMATNKEGQNFEVGLVPFLGNGRANWVSQTQERWLVTARGKLGMTWWDKSMVYVTGGAAWAKIDTSEFLIGAQTGTGHQESNTRTGWTVGAGYEYALGYGWSIKGEYLYVKFDDYTTFTTPPFGGAGLNIAPRSVKLYDNVIRAGMNYKFW
jgi:outer membrane immunogenic protein